MKKLVDLEDPMPLPTNTNKHFRNSLYISRSLLYLEPFTSHYFLPWIENHLERHSSTHSHGIREAAGNFTPQDLGSAVDSL